MSELKNSIWIEKYRPQKIEDLILRNKKDIIKLLEDNDTIPNLLLVSNKPGTGKTSLAKLIIKMTNSDSITINASDERGIDTIRDRVKKFAGALSTNGKRRCIFLDECEGMTRQAQDSLKSIIETYSDNSYFIFTANDSNKVIEPIRSRCVVIDFELPNKEAILTRLNYICEQEDLKTKEDDLQRLVDYSYPDIRSAVNTLQLWKISGKIEFEEDRFLTFWTEIKAKNVEFIYAETYSGTFKILDYTKWMWEKLFDHYENYGLDKTAKIAGELAEVEKSCSLSANLEIIFVNAILQIMKVL